MAKKTAAGTWIPKDLQDRYDQIAAWLKEFSEEYLSEEYYELFLQVLTKLCRKRPTPIVKGRAVTWAAGIAYAAGSVNFIFDRSNKFYMSAQDLADAFGISKSTASNKGAEIRKLLKMSCWNSEWVLPSKMEDNPLIWMVSVNGLAVDARWLPLPEQIICYQKGLIPYVPALEKNRAAKDSEKSKEAGEIEKSQEAKTPQPSEKQAETEK